MRPKLLRRTTVSLPRLVAAGLIIVLAGVALAHEGATGVVKERMDLMKGQAKQMKLINEMAKGKKPFDAQKAAHAARDISTSTKKIPELFPEGTNEPPSEALAEIWENWEEFTGDAEKAATAAEALAGMLQQEPSGGWKEAFRKLTQACKSCHQSFRAENEDKDGGKGAPHHH